MQLRSWFRAVSLLQTFFEAKSINGGEAKYSVSCLIRDLLDAVQDYAGEELRREIEEYIETNVQDIDDYENEYDRMEQENPAGAG